MKILTREQILILHEQQIKRYGGTYGVRDESLLDSALSAPFQSFGGNEFFPTTLEKAVRLCAGLVQNHPFHDGNKRIGTIALLVTLDLNGYRLKTNSNELADIIIKLAAGLINDEELLNWVKEKVD